MKLTVTVLGRPHEVELIRKKMRSIRLRVTQDGEIRLSAPRTASMAELTAFLNQQVGWIEQALQKSASTAPPMHSEKLCDGSAIRLRGESYTLRLEQGAKPHITVDHEIKSIHFCSPRLIDEAYLRARFEEWWRKECTMLFDELCDRFMPIFSAQGISRPTVRVRKMTSLWGSCAAGKGCITLNFYLMRAPMECIEYIVLHELTHLVDRTHGRSFYDFIARYMPDWKRRRELLKNERTS